MRTIFLDIGRKVGCESCLTIWKPKKGVDEVTCPYCGKTKSYKDGRDAYFIVKSIMSW